VFLLQAKQRVEREGVLHERAFKRVLAGYHAILAKGRRRHPGRPGNQAQSKAANLLDRLEGYDLSVLAFLVHSRLYLLLSQARAQHPGRTRKRRPGKPFHPELGSPKPIINT